MKKPYLTPARRAVLSLFSSYPHRHFTAEQVCTLICSANSTDDTLIGKSTVYRQLSRLCEQGLLRRFESTDADGLAVHAYQYVSPEQNCAGHFHLKCQRCGRVSHADANLTERISAQLGAEYNFLVDCGASMLYGLCAVCRAQTKGEM